MLVQVGEDIFDRIILFLQAFAHHVLFVAVVCCLLSSVRRPVCRRLSVCRLSSVVHHRCACSILRLRFEICNPKLKLCCLHSLNVPFCVECSLALHTPPTQCMCTNSCQFVVAPHLVSGFASRHRTPTEKCPQKACHFSGY